MGEKLAQIEMELWAQYRDHIEESREAKSLLKSLAASNEKLHTELKSTIKDRRLADKVLHLVADNQQDNLKHTKHLLDHIVAQGKRGAIMEKHVAREIRQEMTREEQRVNDDDKSPDVQLDDHDPRFSLGSEVGKPKDPLKETLEGFWHTFHDYKAEFGSTVRDTLKNGHPKYEQITELYKRLKGDDP